MENSLEIIQNFWNVLRTYVDHCEQDVEWEKEQKEIASQEQAKRRKDILDENDKRLEKVQVERLKVMRSQELEQTGLRNQVKGKRDALVASVNKNNQLCEKIQAWKSKITNPDYFRHEQEYATYGDYFTEITSLEQYTAFDFANIVKLINEKKTDNLLTKVRLKLGDTNVLMEYASFCNLLNKARYLCGVENEALEKKGYAEIKMLNEQLDEISKKYTGQIAQMKLAEEQERERAHRVLVDLELTEKSEDEELEEKISAKLRQTQKEFKEKLTKEFSKEKLTQIYGELTRNAVKAEQFICQDGHPLRVHLAQLWLEAQENLKIEKIHRIIVDEYPFMIENEKIILPGILA